ncbi:MAG: hypothetical protein AAGK78_07985, partial [Planctomycetota bacterium]
MDCEKNRCVQNNHAEQTLTCSNKPAQQTPATRNTPNPLAMLHSQTLEARRLLSATASLDGGTLTVTG